MELKSDHSNMVDFLNTLLHIYVKRFNHIGLTHCFIYPEIIVIIIAGLVVVFITADFILFPTATSTSPVPHGRQLLV